MKKVTPSQPDLVHPSNLGLNVPNNMVSPVSFGIALIYLSPLLAIFIVISFKINFATELNEKSPTEVIQSMN